MGTFSGPHFCQFREREMIVTSRKELASATKDLTKPVRVKVRRLGMNRGRIYPPEDEGKVWWGRLKSAMGTTSNDFVNASLFQLQMAARLPDGPISEAGMNLALAIIQAAKPQNEIEGALAVQMACTHTAAMALLSRVGSAHGGTRNLALYASAAAKLLRTYAIQVETLRRLRGGGAQYVRVEHVHITDNGQAVIGNVSR